MLIRRAVRTGIVTIPVYFQLTSGKSLRGLMCFMGEKVCPRRGKPLKIKLLF